MIAFTARGAQLAARLREALGTDCRAYAVERYRCGPVEPLKEPLAEWTEQRFRKGTTLVFIGAAGIAVRAVAPFVQSKDTDPAVICIDESGKHIIPLLSGHLGGANKSAQELARLCGGEAVLTTATDVGGVFSPDAWAAEHGCAVADIGEIKHISAALLDGEVVGLATDFPMANRLPEGLVETDGTRCGIEIAFRSRRPYQHTLHLIPRCIVAGIGCRKGVSAEVIRRRLEAVLREHNLPLAAVGTVASINLKAEEPGLLTLCAELDAPLVTYTAAQLMTAEGEFTPSERVQRLAGVDNVCERAAMLAAPGLKPGVLLVRKSAGEGVTVALVRRYWVAEF